MADNKAKSSGTGHERVTVAPDPENSDNVVIRTRKRTRKKRSSGGKKGLSRGKKVALGIVTGIVVVVAAAVIALAVAVHQGNVDLHALFGGSDTEQMPEETVTTDDGETISYKGHTYRYNDNIVSILVIGHDDETEYTVRKDATCADADILLTIDTSTNKVRATVVPRNSWVAVDVYDDGVFTNTRKMQLTLSHAVDVKTAEDAAANTTKSVSRIFYSLPIEKYFDIDMQAFADLTTAVGGVQVKALQDIPGASYSKGDTVLLEGEEALRYAKYRDIYTPESALDRQERQMQLVRALAAKASKLSAAKLLKVINGVRDDTTTNLSASDLSYLVSCFLTGDNAELDMGTLKGKTKAVKESDGNTYERYYLNNASVMKNTLAAFYTQVD